MSALVIRVSQLEGYRRTDAEYYQPRYIELTRRFEKFKSLAEVGAQIFHPAEVKRIYGEEGLQLLLAQNIRANRLDFSHVGFLPFEVEPELRRNRLQAGDVAVTRSGVNFGDAAPYDGTPSPIYISADCILLRCKSVSGAYLSTFLNTDIGRALARRGVYGAAQPHLAPEYLGTLRIPRDARTEKAVDQKLKEAKAKSDESEKLYAQAQSLLVAELGLDKLDLSESLYSVRRVSEVAESGRADAEYFQPKYQKMMAALGRSGKRIEDVAELAARRFKPQPGASFNYIEISDLSGDGHLESTPLMGEEAPSRAQWIVRAGDVITSTVRPVRRLSALVESEQDGFVCSSGFAVLKPKDVEPELLLLYLRLPIVCEVLDLYTTASMYPAISTSDLFNILVTLPESRSLQEELASKVKASRQARRDAHRLLEEAKAQVERMIEHA